MLQRRGDFRILKAVAQILRLFRRATLTGEYKLIGHFTQRKPQSERRSGKESRTMHYLSKGLREFGIADGLRRHKVQRTPHATVFEREPQQVHHIIQSDPAHPLFTGADFAPHSELKCAQHRLQSASVFCENDAEASQHHSDAQSVGFDCLDFPIRR